MKRIDYIARVVLADAWRAKLEKKKMGGAVKPLPSLPIPNSAGGNAATGGIGISVDERSRSDREESPIIGPDQIGPIRAAPVSAGNEVLDDLNGPARDGRSGAGAGSATLPTSHRSVSGVAGPYWSPKTRESGLPTYPHCSKQAVEFVAARQAPDLVVSTGARKGDGVGGTRK